MKMWTKHCPENFQHKYDLIEAEKYRIQGKIELAKKHYDIAIYGANREQFWSEEAMAWEFAANFYFEEKNIILAQTYIQNAFNCYKRWGASTKCKQLEYKYPQYISIKQDKSVSNSNSVSIHTNTSTIASGESFDLSSIIRAGQTLAGEVKLENLLENMLKIIMENAGAEYAVIIINNNGKFEVQAKGRHDAKNMQVLESENIDNSQTIPERIIKYVIRARRFLILDDAINNNSYSNETYIQENNVKSVFCHPVIHKDKMATHVKLDNCQTLLRVSDS